MRVVTDHGRFNLKQAVKDANDVALVHYVEYDHGNQMDAKKFLLASLEDDLRKQLFETGYLFREHVDPASILHIFLL